jgi:hypothetical protein
MTTAAAALLIDATTPTSIEGRWFPPPSGGLCFLTGHATNGDGGVATVTAAVLTHPGTQGTSTVPQIDARLFTSNGLCQFHNTEGAEPTACLSAGRFGNASLQPTVDWGTGDPGTVRVTADCGHPSNSGFDYRWEVLGSSGGRCTVTVRATSLQGVQGVAQAQFTIQ